MNIMGIDTSTKTGISVLSDDPAFCFATELTNKKVTGMERLEWFEGQIATLLDTHKPELAVIENYGFANAFTLVPLVEIGTVFRMVLRKKGVKMVLVPPTSLKRAITGKGVAPKDVIMLEVFKKWGFEAKTNNIADAYGLAKIGQYLLGLEKFTKDISSNIEKLESVKEYRLAIAA